MAAKCEENVKEVTTHAFENWASTEIQVVKIRFTWTIKNFSFCSEKPGQKIISPPFPNETINNTKWRLDLYPSGINSNNAEYLSMFLVLESSDVKEVEAKFKISILDARHGRINTSQFNTRLFVPGRSWGFDKFLTREFLFDPENDVLQDDNFTIFCEICVAINRVNKSGKIRVSEPLCDLQHDFGLLFENPMLSDVTLCTKEETIHAHKLILSARSSVFRAMFSHKMEENKTNQVNVKDINNETLKEMLRYIYSGEAPRLKDMATELLFAADMYALDTLKLMCEKELCESLSIENVAEIFQIASAYNSQQLKVQAKYFLAAHASEVVKTDGWKSMYETHPKLAAEALLSIITEEGPSTEE